MFNPPRPLASERVEEVQDYITSYPSPWEGVYPLPYPALDYPSSSKILGLPHVWSSDLTVWNMFLNSQTPGCSWDIQMFGVQISLFAAWFWTLWLTSKCLEFRSPVCSMILNSQTLGRGLPLPWVLSNVRVGVQIFPDRTNFWTLNTCGQTHKSTKKHRKMQNAQNHKRKQKSK